LPLSWLFGVAAVGLALVLKLYLHKTRISDESPFIFFMAAVLATVAVGGLGAGLIATVVAVLAVDYFILTPGMFWSGNSASQNVLLAIFAAEGAFVSFLGAALRRSRGLAEEQGRAVRQSEARLRRMVEGNLIPIIFRDEQGQITDANEAFLQLVGYTRSDVRDGRLRTIDLTPNEYRAAEKRAFEELAGSVSCRPFEMEYFRKDRRRVPVLVSMVRLGDTTDEMVCFVFDLTRFPHVRTSVAAGPHSAA
jgi:PAS domain S-box-containing protein